MFNALPLWKGFTERGKKWRVAGRNERAGLYWSVSGEGIQVSLCINMEIWLWGAGGRREDLLGTSIMLAFRGLVIKTCLIEDQSRCSGCQEAKCCSIVRTISSCLGNKANLQPTAQLFILQPWEAQDSLVGLTAEGIESGVQQLILPSLDCSVEEVFLTYFKRMLEGIVGHRGPGFDKGVSMQVIYRTVEITQ